MTETSTPDTDYHDLADRLWLKERCNRWFNGECSSRRCLLNGGYSGTGSVNFNIATCDAKEIYEGFKQAAEEIDSLRHQCLELSEEINDMLKAKEPL